MPEIIITGMNTYSMAYRSAVQESTKFSPNELMFGCQVRLPIDLMYEQPPHHNPPQNQTNFVQKQQEHMNFVHERAAKH